MFTDHKSVISGLALGWALAMGAAAGAQSLTPRPEVIKPERTNIDPQRHEQHVILVKFRDAIPARLRDGRPTDISGQNGLADANALLEGIDPGSGAMWQRMSHLPEETLDAMRANAQQRLGRAVASMNNYFHLILPAHLDASAVIDAFNALDSVELAEPIDLPPPSPGDSAVGLTPSYQSQQGWLGPAPHGMDAEYIWDSLGASGAGVRIVDVEYDFNANHLDLPEVAIMGGQPSSPLGSNHHGTAVMGMLGAKNNGWGTTGLAPESDLHFAGTFTAGYLNVAGAILTASADIEEGDVILVEAQAWGPNADPPSGSSYGCVPVEWRLADYNAIVTAVGNGRIVVSVAGNGSQNLDDPIYSEGNSGHWPFLPENDSGSILVGAGHAPLMYGGSNIDRARMHYSNYGSRVNMQGWGQAVYTTGFGNLYSGGGANLFYTHNFNGTSSAGAMVAGAVALLQSAHKQEFGEAMSPSAMRDLLIETGSPQQNGTFPASQHIGPRPNLAAAAQMLIDGYVHSPIGLPGDLNGDGAVGVIDMLLLLGSWGMCEGASQCPADLNGDGQVGVQDLLLLIGYWG